MLEIEPGRGVGPIILGMRKSEVRSVFNERVVYEDWMQQGSSDTNFHGLRLDFAESPSFRLIRITVHCREDATLFGRTLTRWKKSRLVLRFEESLIHYAVTNHGDLNVPGMTLSFNEKNRLSWVEVYPLGTT